jgi:hypothetical protein
VTTRVLPPYLFLSQVYTDGKQLGGGSYADVYEGEHRGEKIALKVLRTFGRSQDLNELHEARALYSTIWLLLIVGHRRSVERP